MRSIDGDGYTNNLSKEKCEEINQQFEQWLLQFFHEHGIQPDVIKVSIEIPGTMGFWKQTFSKLIYL